MHRDDRGFFYEGWNQSAFAANDLSLNFVQDNTSVSHQYVLRGLHYQSSQAAQGKLVWVGSGAVYDVVVDLRRSSPTYGLWDGFELSAAQHRRLWVPPGCAHGFLALSEPTVFHYKVTAPYCPAAERCLAWNDGSLAIAWPLNNDLKPLLSPKDSSGDSFYNCEKFP